MKLINKGLNFFNKNKSLPKHLDLEQDDIHHPDISQSLLKNFDNSLNSPNKDQPESNYLLEKVKINHTNQTYHAKLKKEPQINSKTIKQSPEIKTNKQRSFVQQTENLEKLNQFKLYSENNTNQLQEQQNEIVPKDTVIIYNHKEIKQQPIDSSQSFHDKSLISQENLFVPKKSEKDKISDEINNLGSKLSQNSNNVFKQSDQYNKDEGMNKLDSFGGFSEEKQIQTSKEDYYQIQGQNQKQQKDESFQTIVTASEVSYIQQINSKLKNQTKILIDEKNQLKFVLDSNQALIKNKLNEIQNLKQQNLNLSNQLKQRSISPIIKKTSYESYEPYKPQQRYHSKRIIRKTVQAKKQYQNIDQLTDNQNRIKELEEKNYQFKQVLIQQFGNKMQNQPKYENYTNLIPKELNIKTIQQPSKKNIENYTINYQTIQKQNMKDYNIQKHVIRNNKIQSKQFKQVIKRQPRKIIRISKTNKIEPKIFQTKIKTKKIKNKIKPKSFQTKIQPKNIQSKIQPRTVQSKIQSQTFQPEIQRRNNLKPIKKNEKIIQDQQNKTYPIARSIQDFEEIFKSKLEESEKNNQLPFNSQKSQSIKKKSLHRIFLEEKEQPLIKVTDRDIYLESINMDIVSDQQIIILLKFKLLQRCQTNKIKTIPYQKKDYQNLYKCCVKITIMLIKRMSRIQRKRLFSVQIISIISIHLMRIRKLNNLKSYLKKTMGFMLLIKQVVWKRKFIILRVRIKKN